MSTTEHVLTSAGAAAGFDLCLHLVRRDLGAEVASEVARAAVMPLERAGGQAQFIVHEPPVDDHTSIGQLLTWIEQNPSAGSLASCHRTACGHEHQNAEPALPRASWRDSSQLDRACACPPCASPAGNDAFGSRASGRRIRVWISSRDAPTLRRNCRNDPTRLPTRILGRKETNIQAPGASTSSRNKPQLDKRELIPS